MLAGKDLEVEVVGCGGDVLLLVMGVEVLGMMGLFGFL